MEEMIVVKYDNKIALVTNKEAKDIEKFEFENERLPIYGEILDDNDEAVDLTLYSKCTSLNDVINAQLSSDISITTNLTLTSGLLLLGNYNVVLASATTITGGGVTNMIVINGTGKLIKNYNN